MKRGERERESEKWKQRVVCQPRARVVCGTCVYACVQIIIYRTRTLSTPLPPLPTPAPQAASRAERGASRKAWVVVVVGGLYCRARVWNLRRCTSGAASSTSVCTTALWSSW